MPYYAYNSTFQFKSSVTSIFDFIWPTAAALWNLRWQVQGYKVARPNCDDKELHNRFVAGSEIWGTNLTRNCIEQTWEKQQEDFAKFLLITAIAAYEDWTMQFCKELNIAGVTSNSLQFPRPVASNKLSVLDALTAIDHNKSKHLHALHTAMTQQEKYDRYNINNLLICYRYFKEIRNCLMHQGGVATHATQMAYSNFVAIADVAKLGVSEVPKYAVIASGSPVHVYLRGVVGLCDVLLRIASTLDYEGSKVQGYEQILIKRWVAKHKGIRRTLKAGDSRASLQVSRYVNQIGYPKFNDVSLLIPLLEYHKLISRV